MENKDMTEKPLQKLHHFPEKKGKMARIPNKRPMGHTACLKNTATHKLNKI